MQRRYLAGAILAATGLAWLLRFVQDDAFISFRYAANLAAGNGLVWNVGERLEGYTNFLWTVLMAVPIRLGWDPITFSYTIGIVLFPVTLLAVYELARRVAGSERVALLVVMATGCNYTFAAYATGGLETALQSFLMVASLLAADSAVSTGRIHLRWVIGLSITVVLSLLTRLDSVLLVGGSVVWVAISIFGLRMTPIKRLTALGVLIGLPTLIVGGWLAWKLTYYGHVLPNSYYLKVGHGASVPRGVYYVLMFLVTYLLLPFPFIWMLRAKRIRQALGLRWTLLLAIPFTVWTLYAVAVGGDFMEFRLAVPVWPLFALLAIMSAWRWFDGFWRFLLIALLPVGSLFHALTFDRIGFFSRGMVTIPGLTRQLEAPLQDWSGIGKYLAGTLGGSNLRIAVTAAGAIPYYSGLPAVDMLGPNDAWVARHGVVIGDRPGHQRLATVAYLREREVDLVIGHPIVVKGMPADARVASRHLSLLFGFRAIPDPESLPHQATIVAIPFALDRVLLAITLGRSPSLDNAIRSRGWVEWPLHIEAD